jgi:4'-phosphopantetheinyl transferase
MTLTLGSHEAHLWYVDDDSVDEDALNTWSKFLSAEERQRGARFRFVADRRRFLIGRGLLRTRLSRYVEEVPPHSWRFASNAWGRPSLATPLAQDIRFNVSHTRGLVVCVLSVAREVGVDAEAMDLQSGHLEIAQGHFAPSEIADLQLLAETMRADRFYEYWTLKESYVKARGVGLSLPLDSF